MGKLLAVIAGAVVGWWAWGWLDDATAWIPGDPHAPVAWVLRALLTLLAFLVASVAALKLLDALAWTGRQFMIGWRRSGRQGG